VDASHSLGMTSYSSGFVKNFYVCPQESWTMHPDDEKILKITKEVIVKFIELGRISPSNFEQHFNDIFWAVKRTVISARAHELEMSGEDSSNREQAAAGKSKG